MQVEASCRLGMRLFKNSLCFNLRSFSPLEIRNTAVEVQTGMMIRNVCTAERAVYVRTWLMLTKTQMFNINNFILIFQQIGLVRVTMKIWLTYLRSTNCCFHVDCRNDDNSRFFDGKELGRTTYPDENPAGFQVKAAASQSLL